MANNLTAFKGNIIVTDKAGKTYIMTDSGEYRIVYDIGSTPHTILKDSYNIYIIAEDKILYI